MDNVKFLFEYSPLRSFIAFLLIGLVAGMSAYLRMLDENKEEALSTGRHSETDILMTLVGIVLKWIVYWAILAFGLFLIKLRPIIAMLNC